MGPLDGIRVLDMSEFPPGRYCSMILGDLGAEVIMVERPVKKEPASRRVVDDTSAWYIGHNRNKKSVVVDIKNDMGRKVFYDLIEKSDVFIDANRPGVLKRRGMDYEKLKELNPGLIYCAITGYGQDGPYSQRTGHEINFGAITGIIGLTGNRNGPPVYLQSPSIAGIIGGVNQAVIAITAALYARQNTGRGQFIDVSITDGMIFYHWVNGPQYFLTGKLPERADSPTGSDIASNNIYRAKDGKYLTVYCGERLRWQSFCRLVGREDFIPHRTDPAEQQREMYSAFSDILATRDRDEWVKMLNKENISAAPVNRLDEVFTDPHFKHRGVIVEVEHRKLGKTRLLNTPFKFSETEASVRTGPPLFGENTGEVLLDLLGYSLEEVQKLVTDGIVQDNKTTG